MKLKLWLLMIVLIGSCCSASEGFATYYTTESCQREGTSGVKTANGEDFDESALTCAMRDKRCYRKGDKRIHFIVTNLETGLSCEVILNDFGPGKKATKNGVIIDLTPAAKKAIGMKGGKCKVRVEEKKS